MAFSSAEATHRHHGQGRRGPSLEASTLMLSCGHDEWVRQWEVSCFAAQQPPRAAPGPSIPMPEGQYVPKQFYGKCLLPFSDSPGHSCLPRCAASKAGDSTPLSSLSHKYLAVAGQLAGTVLTPGCQIHPAVPMTHRPSLALPTCCRPLPSPGPAGKGPGAGGREERSHSEILKQFSNNTSAS